MNVKIKSLAYDLIKKINNYYFFLIFYTLALAVVLIPYYKDGTIILGGEGNSTLDYEVHLKNFGFAWHPTYGNSTGMPNFNPSGTGLNIFLLLLIEKITGNITVSNFISIYLIYFLPFFAMYLICRKLEAGPYLSFVISLFYIVNPFTLYYLIFMNQLNVFVVTIIPLSMFIILKYYYNNFRLFFFFGLISSAFSFTYSNLPLLGIFLLSIPACLFIIMHYYENSGIFCFIRKCIVLITSFITFNIWWIITFIIGSMDLAQKTYSEEFARNWLDMTVRDFYPIMARVFMFTQRTGKDPSYDFFSFCYNLPLTILISLVPILIVCFYFLKNSRERRYRNNIIILGLLLITAFFVKGNSGFMGCIYSFLFTYLPYFNLFKTPVEKFGILFIFIFSILLLFIMLDLKKNKYFNYILVALNIYLIFCCMPIFTGNIIPDYRIRGANTYCSRRYIDKKNYKKVREIINNSENEYRVLNFPGSGNYQVCMINYDNNYYTGLDPLIMNINKPFIMPFNSTPLFYKYVTFEGYARILGMYNVGKIIINDDIKPWYGFAERENTNKLKEIFGKTRHFKKYGNLMLYYNKDYFLPRIYVSSSKEK